MPDDIRFEDGPGIEPQAERALTSSAEAYRLVQEARDMRAERDAALAQLVAVRELVSADDDESTVDAVRFVVEEWRHYSREMNRAGYVTIPALTAERDAAWAAIRGLHAGLEEHPVCVHGPEYDEATWQNGCSFCPLVRPLFDLVPGLVEEE